jgi:hypothetical protein
MAGFAYNQIRLSLLFYNCKRAGCNLLSYKILGTSACDSLGTCKPVRACGCHANPLTHHAAGTAVQHNSLNHTVSSVALNIRVSHV